MDTIENYRQIIRTVIKEYADFFTNPYSDDLKLVPVFDCVGDHYLLITLGRERGRRVHSCLIHVDIVDGKFWIQHDDTEEGVATDLLNAGVPKEHIVLGFRSAKMRKYSEFAVA
jgi:hypothetical protein